MVTGRGGVTCSSHIVSQKKIPCAPAIFDLNHSSFYHGRTVSESGIFSFKAERAVNKPVFVFHCGAKGGNRKYPPSVYASCEHNKLENKRRTIFCLGVWLRLRKIPFENWVGTSESKMAFTINQPPQSFKETRLSFFILL